MYMYIYIYMHRVYSLTYFGFPSHVCTWLCHVTTYFYQLRVLDSENISSSLTYELRIITDEIVIIMRYINLKVVVFFFLTKKFLSFTLFRYHVSRFVFYLHDEARWMTRVQRCDV